MAMPPMLKGARLGRIDLVADARASELASGAGTERRTQVHLSFYRRYGKRALDVMVGSVLFIGLMPVMAFVAIAVLVTSGWPIFHRAQRHGRHGRLFRMLKFRTMVRNADEVLHQLLESDKALASEYQQNLKLRDDPRATWFGSFLRRSSIDELPQLWNVLVGEMSLVGPRPVTWAEVRKYGSHSSTLLSLRPGMTGSWQVNGRNEVSYPDRMQLELDYCRSADLPGDARILLRSLIVPLQYNGR